MSYWQGKKVLVTGGAGFIGSHLVELLLSEGATVRVADNLERGSLAYLKDCLPSIEFVQLDLTKEKACHEVCRDIDVVMNLAAKVAGIDYNQKHQASMFLPGVRININMLEAARQRGVRRYLCVSSACVYPRYCTIPTPETEGFKDDPEPTNFGYGWAKRVAEVQAQCYVQEYGMEIAVVRPYNTYGPRDHFDPQTSHVIPALIRRVLEGEDPLVVWGDGEQTRAFVYVTDIARGMMLAVGKYPGVTPINLGTTEEIKIRHLAEMIVRLSGLNPKIRFDTSKPAGQPRRNADVTKAQRLLGYTAQVNLEEGLKKTIDWYRAHIR